VLADIDFVRVCMSDGCSLRCCSCRFYICVSQSEMGLCTASKRANEPRCTPPPSPVILFNLEVPPALILASRRSRRMRACSEALDGGVAAGEDVVGGVSAMLEALAQCEVLCKLSRLKCWKC
jgi:hypothetical protein